MLGLLDIGELGVDVGKDETVLVSNWLAVYPGWWSLVAAI